MDALVRNSVEAVWSILRHNYFLNESAILWFSQTVFVVSDYALFCQILVNVLCQIVVSQFVVSLKADPRYTKVINYPL